MDGVLIAIAISVATATAPMHRPAPAATNSFRSVLERPVVVFDGEPQTAPVGRQAGRQINRPLVGQRTLRGGLPKVVIGALAGVLAGGVLGYVTTQDCVCDSPGLEGLMLGIPIGGIVGGLVTWQLTR